jgi:hypothetical protein
MNFFKIDTQTTGTTPRDLRTLSLRSACFEPAGILARHFHNTHCESPRRNRRPFEPLAAILNKYNGLWLNGWQYDHCEAYRCQDDKGAGIPAPAPTQPNGPAAKGRAAAAPEQRFRASTRSPSVYRSG